MEGYKIEKLKWDKDDKGIRRKRSVLRSLQWKDLQQSSERYSMNL